MKHVHRHKIKTESPLKHTLLYKNEQMREKHYNGENSIRQKISHVPISDSSLHNIIFNSFRLVLVLWRLLTLT